MQHKHRGLPVLTGFILWLAILGSAVAGCSGGGSDTGARSDDPAAGGKAAGALVTFMELGSDKCIPCIKMRPVMEEIQAQYGDQVRVVFHDVWTPEGQPYARQFGIRVIPTQVFLDAEGREYFRHEGYFPTAEVAKILGLKGVNTR